MLLFLFSLFLGTLCGIVAALYGLDYLSRSDDVQRRIALLRAEREVRDVQTRALREMAGAVDRAIQTHGHDQLTGHTRRWASDQQNQHGQQGHYDSEIVDVEPRHSEGQ